MLCHTGKYAAEANNAEIVDPREYYQGTLRRTLKKYRHIGKTIPAMGYSPKEVTALGMGPACHTDAPHIRHKKLRRAWWQTVARTLPLMRRIPGCLCYAYRQSRQDRGFDSGAFWCRVMASETVFVLQVEDLAKTINAVPADAVVVATPMDLNRLIHMSKPSTTVA